MSGWLAPLSTAPMPEQAMKRRDRVRDVVAVEMRRQKRGVILGRVLRAIDALSKPDGATLGAIAFHVNRDVEGLSGQVRTYYTKGYISRSGRTKTYRYKLTALGRDRLAEPDTRDPDAD